MRKTRVEAKPVILAMAIVAAQSCDRVLAPFRVSVPGWRLGWLAINLAPLGPTASDAELDLDRLLNLDLG
jgi:hypothetical protein